MIIHLESHAGDFDAPITLVAMRCGEVVLIDDDAMISPAGHDFVMAPDRLQLVDCGKCLALMALDQLRERSRALT